MAANGIDFLLNFITQGTGSAVGNIASVGLGMGTLTAAIIAAGKAAADFALGFDKAMRNVNSIAQETETNFKRMVEGVRALSTDKDISDGPTVLAKGMYQLVSSGFEAAEALKLTGIASKAASAGLTTTETSVKALAGLMNAYNQKTLPDAIKFSDQLFKVVDKGVISFEELATNLGSVSATASANKVAFKEVGAAFIELTRVGVSAAESETAITNLIRSIAGASPEAKAFAKNLGVDLSDVALETKGLVGVMDELYRATGGAASVMDKIIPEARASKAALTLGKEGAEGFKRALDEMATSAGSAEKALSQQALAGQFGIDKLKTETELLKGVFGDLVIEITGPFVEGLRNLIKFLLSLDEETKKSIVSWGLFIVKITAVLGVIGSLALAFGPASALVTGILGVGAAIKTLLLVGFLGSAGNLGLIGAFSAISAALGTQGAVILGLTALAGSLAVITAAAAAAYGAFKTMQAAWGWLEAKSQNNIEQAAADKQKKNALELTKEFHKLNQAQKEALKSDKLREYSQAFTDLITSASSGSAKKYLRDQAIGLEQMAKGLEEQAKVVKAGKIEQSKLDAQAGRDYAEQVEKDLKAKEEAEKKAKAAKEKAIADQKRKDEDYLQFSKDLADKKAKINLDAFQKELYEIEKARKADLSKTRTQGDKDTVNAVYNKQVEDATKAHNEQIAKDAAETTKKSQDFILNSEYTTTEEKRNILQQRIDIEKEFSIEHMQAVENLAKFDKALEEKANKESLDRLKQQHQDMEEAEKQYQDGLAIQQQAFLNIYNDEIEKNRADYEVLQKKFDAGQIASSWEFHKQKLVIMNNEKELLIDLIEDENLSDKERIEAKKELLRLLKLIAHEEEVRKDVLDADDLKNKVNKFDDLINSLKSSSIKGLQYIGDFAQGIVSNINKGMDAVKAAANGDFLPLIDSIASEIINSVGHISDAMDILSKKDISSGEMAEGIDSLTRSIPFIGGMMADAQRAVWDFFNITIPQKTLEGIAKFGDTVSQKETADKQALEDAKELSQLIIDNIENEVDQRYAQTIFDIQQVEKSLDSREIKTEKIKKITNDWHKWYKEHEKKLQEDISKINDQAVKDWQDNIKDKRDLLTKAKDKELSDIKELTKAKRKEGEDAVKAVADTLKEIDKLYQDRIDDQKDKSGLNSIFQQRLSAARGQVDASITRPNEVDFNVGNGLTTGNETQRKKIQDDYELGVISFDQMRAKMQEVALQKYLFYEEEVARVSDPELKASAEAKRIDAQKEFYQFAEDKEAKALNKKLAGQKAELKIKLDAITTAEREEIASIGRITAEYQKMVASYVSSLQEGLNNIKVSGSINGADGKGTKSPITKEQNSSIDKLQKEAWDYGTVEGKNILKQGQSLEDLRNTMRSGGVNFDGQSSSTSKSSYQETAKSSTGYQDAAGHWFDANGRQLTFAKGGVTNRPSIFGEAGPEAAIPLFDFQNIYNFVKRTVSNPNTAMAGGGVVNNYNSNTVVIDASKMDKNQLISAVETVFNKFGNQIGNTYIPV